MSVWFQITLAAIAVIISGSLSWLSYKKGKAELFYKLFTDFNERYSHLNDKLYHILDREKALKKTEVLISDFRRDEINTVMDYLNLSSEEYMWYKKGYIDKPVWKAWQQGIQWWYDNSKLIQHIWDDELDQRESYYIRGNDSFIKTK